MERQEDGMNWGQVAGVTGAGALAAGGAYAAANAYDDYKAKKSGGSSASAGSSTSTPNPAKIDNPALKKLAEEEAEYLKRKKAEHVSAARDKAVAAYNKANPEKTISLDAADAEIDKAIDFKPQEAGVYFDKRHKQTHIEDLRRGGAVGEAESHEHLAQKRAAIEKAARADAHQRGGLKRFGSHIPILGRLVGTERKGLLSGNNSDRVTVKGSDIDKSRARFHNSLVDQVDRHTSNLYYDLLDVEKQLNSQGLSPVGPNVQGYNAARAELIASHEGIQEAFKGLDNANAQLHLSNTNPQAFDEFLGLKKPAPAATSSVAHGAVSAESKAGRNFAKAAKGMPGWGKGLIAGAAALTAAATAAAVIPGNKPRSHAMGYQMDQLQNGMGNGAYLG